MLRRLRAAGPASSHRRHYQTLAGRQTGTGGYPLQAGACLHNLRRRSGIPERGVRRMGCSSSSSNSVVSGPAKRGAGACRRHPAAGLRTKFRISTGLPAWIAGPFSGSSSRCNHADTVPEGIIYKGVRYTMLSWRDSLWENVSFASRS